MQCMIKSFTQDDVIRYSYDEMEPTERMSFEVALAINSDLNFLLESIEESKVDLDSILQSPRHVIVDQVLKYSSHTASMEHTL